MAEVSSFKQGEFCWFELATSDQPGAKKFYSNLFGWQINDQPMGPDQFYTMLEKNGKPVGALYGMDGGQLAAGVPPHWNTYISVDNVDASSSKAESLGGKVVLPPFDVMDAGRMSVVQDPTGAMVCLWQAARHQGAGVIDENNAFCWYELATHDTTKAQSFYTNLLGWSTGGSPEYVEWKNGERTVGGMMEIQKEWGEMPANWMNYVMVENVDSSVENAKSLGGTLINGPMEVPGTGRFAVLQDPQGAMFSVFQPSPKA